MFDPTVVETIVVNVDDKQASRAYDGLEQSQRDLAKAVRSLDGAVRDSMGSIGRTAKDAGRKVDGLNSRLLNLDAALGLAQKSAHALRGAFDALQRPVDLATGFEAGVAQIRTLGQDLAADFDDQLLALARDLPQTAGDLTRATYDAISAGIKPTQVLEFIRDTSDAAVAGGAKLTESVGVLTTAVNAFPELGGDAAKAADILFATVRAGVTDFRQLAATDVGASLAAFGVKLAEVGALSAEFTKRGQSQSEALTTIQALTKSIIAPSAKAARVFKRLGVETGAAALQSKGLTAILAEINDAAGGNVEVISQLTQRQEALRGLVPLLSGGFDQYAQTLATVSATQGATAESAAIMANTAQGAQARFRSLTEGVLTQLGREVLPVVNELLQDLGAWLDANGDELVATIKSVVEGLADIGKWVAANGKEIVAFVSSLFVAKKVNDWTAAVRGAISELGKIGPVAEFAGQTVAQRLFNPRSLGGALSAALRSPAFVGLALGAAASIGSIVGDVIGSAATESIRARGEQALAQSRQLEAANVARLKALGLEVTSGADVERVTSEAVSGARLGAAAGFKTQAQVFEAALKETGDRQKAIEALGDATFAEIDRRQAEIKRIEGQIAETQIKADEIRRAASAAYKIGLEEIGDERRQQAEETRRNISAMEAQVSRIRAAETALLRQQAQLVAGKPAAPTGPSPGPGPGAGAGKPDEFAQALRDQISDLELAGIAAEDAVAPSLRSVLGESMSVLDGFNLMRDGIASASADIGSAIRGVTGEIARQNREFQAGVAEVSAYSSAASAALGSLGAIAEMAGASSAALATIKIAENIANATEQGAKALGAGAIGNIPGAITHGAAAAQHTAAAIKWGADALGGRGGGAAGGSGGGVSAAAAPRPTPAALPPPQQQQPAVIQMTINGLIATDQRAATMLGSQVARGVAAQMGRDMGRRGAMPLPASAGRRF